MIIGKAEEGKFYYWLVLVLVQCWRKRALARAVTTEMDTLKIINNILHLSLGL